MNRNGSVHLLRRQFIVAIVMVLVSAIALASSTFAWFANSSEAKAQNMSVIASANVGYLEIQNAGADFTGSSIAVDAANAGSTSSLDLKPVTPFLVDDLTKDGTEDTNQLAVSSTSTAAGYGDGFIWTWTTAELGTDSSKGTEAGWTRADHSADNYYLINNFKFRSAVDNYETDMLYAGGVTVTGLTSDALDEAVRVLIVGEDGMQMYDIGTASWTYFDENGTKINKADFAGLIEKIVYQDEGAEGQAIQVFVYYEGDDTRLFTANLNSMAGVTVAIAFAVDPDAF